MEIPRASAHKGKASDLEALMKRWSSSLDPSHLRDPIARLAIGQIIFPSPLLDLILGLFDAETDGVLQVRVN